MPNKLCDLGKDFYDKKYKEHFGNLFNISVRNWFKPMGNDPVSTRISFVILSESLIDFWIIFSSISSSVHQAKENGYVVF